VAMMVLLLGDPDREFCVGRRLASQLARLGITSVAFVRDEEMVGVVLEGWLFDPARSGEAAADAVGASKGARALHPVADLAVSIAAEQGGRDVQDAPSTRA